MADERDQNQTPLTTDQQEFMKKMKAIASDLWGGISNVMGTPDGAEDAPIAEPVQVDAEAETARPAGQTARPGRTEPTEMKKSGESGETRVSTPAPAKRPADLRQLWKTADETIDWTDALTHSTPSDGLTGKRMWLFYHEQAAKVLAGDLKAYAEVLKTADPLGDLANWAVKMSVRTPGADRLEVDFICDPEQMEANAELYLAAMSLRAARDLMACLPVSEVAVTGKYKGKAVMRVTYPRQKLLHRNFAFLDPIALAKECGAVYEK